MLASLLWFFDASIISTSHCHCRSFLVDELVFAMLLLLRKNDRVIMGGGRAICFGPVIGQRRSEPGQSHDSYLIETTHYTSSNEHTDWPTARTWIILENGQQLTERAVDGKK
jgi:hypothetical protein